MQKNFYNYPKSMKLRKYRFKRRTDGMKVVYEVCEDRQQLGFLQITEDKKIIPISGWYNDKFSGVEEVLKNYLRNF